MKGERLITQEQVATIPDGCTIFGGVVGATVNTEIDGQRYLSGTTVCKRAPLLESQRESEACPDPGNCILHTFRSRVEVTIKNDPEIDKRVEELRRKRDAAITNAMADGF